MYYVKIQNVLFKFASKHDSVYKFENCEHIFIKDCEIYFVAKNITKENFPKLKFISTNYILNDGVNNQFYDRFITSEYTKIDYKEINKYYFDILNKYTFIGTEK